MYKKAGKLGLHVAYRNKNEYFKVMRKLFVLPFLPAEHMEEAFVKLEDRCKDSPQLSQLTRYMRETWFQSSVWSLELLSVYKQPVRTNNDVEGWHQQLNVRSVNARIPFYVLVPLLRKEGEYLRLQVNLLEDKKLKRYQKKCYKTMQATIFKLWDEYKLGTRNTGSLLNAIARIYSPVNSD